MKNNRENCPREKTVGAGTAIPEYTIIRSERHTLALEVRGTRIIVRAPRRTTQAQIAAFVGAHSEWIGKKLEKALSAPPLPPLTDEELRALAEHAREVIPRRVAAFAPLVGVTWGKITIRSQRTKWGSCSSLGNLNFNCLLMLTPPEVLDSVVVHELCHRLEMNHSERFRREVLRVMPDYDRAEAWLRENGAALMSRLERN